MLSTEVNTTEEPGAGKLHAGICEGCVRKLARLPRFPFETMLPCKDNSEEQRKLIDALEGLGPDEKNYLKDRIGQVGELISWAETIACLALLYALYVLYDPENLGKWMIIVVLLCFLFCVFSGFLSTAQMTLNPIREIDFESQEKRSFIKTLIKTLIQPRTWFINALSLSLLLLVELVRRKMG